MRATHARMKRAGHPDDQLLHFPLQAARASVFHKTCNKVRRLRHIQPPRLARPLPRAWQLWTRQMPLVSPCKGDSCAPVLPCRRSRSRARRYCHPEKSGTLCRSVACRSAAAGWW